MDDFEPSKTHKKKAVEALQALAIRLTKLPKDLLDAMPLSAVFYDALKDYQKITSNGAKRRQAQYLGKLIKKEPDLDEIQLKLSQFDNHNAQRDAEFHQCEKWRDTLLSGKSDALTAFMAAYPKVDGQLLRQLIKKAQKDIEMGKNTGAYTRLFRLIREVIDV